MISSAQFNDLVKNALVQWREGREEFPSVRSQYVITKSVSEATSEHSEMSQLPTAKRRHEGGKALQGNFKQGYSKNFKQSEIGLQVDITKQMKMFDKYGLIYSRMRNAGKSTERRVELDLASLLSYAFTSSYTNIDGETVATTNPAGNPLIYLTQSCNGSSSTYSNQLATTNSAFDQTILEKLEELFNGFLDESDGRLLPVVPDSIITGRHAPTKHSVRRVLESEFYTENANNTKNTVNNYQHVVVPFIDLNCQTEARDSNKYKFCFVAALNSSDNKFLLEESQPIRLEAPDAWNETSTSSFLSTALYDFGSLGSNFIAGTKGDGSAV